MARYTISSEVLNALNVYHIEAISECLFLQVSETGVVYVIKASVAEDLQQGLVINSNDEVLASKDKVPSLVQCISNSESLALDRAYRDSAE